MPWICPDTHNEFSFWFNLDLQRYQYAEWELRKCMSEGGYCMGSLKPSIISMKDKCCYLDLHLVNQFMSLSDIDIWMTLTLINRMNERLEESWVFFRRKGKVIMNWSTKPEHCNSPSCNMTLTLKWPWNLSGSGRRIMPSLDCFSPWPQRSKFS